MASFKFPRHTLLNFLLLLFALSQSFYQLSHLVAADNKLIEIVCHETDMPEVCVQCLTSDPDAETADRLGLTNIVVYCLDNHASSLESNMSNMSSVYKDRSTKKVLLGCSQGYLASKKDLLAAIVSLKSGQFDDAETSVTMTLDRHMSCLKRIEQHKEVQISSKLAYEMKIYEDLCQIADRIIERL